MLSRYGVFCRVMEAGGFTRAAEAIGYSQSSVSQTVRALEQELGVTLIERRRDGLVLTADGRQFMPYIQAIHTAELALEEKKRELSGLENTVVAVGTFTSVSRNLLPLRIEAFKERYPSVKFVLRQGEYTSISGWIRDGSVDLGFVSTEIVTDLDAAVLRKDAMMAVLPQGHPLARKAAVTLAELAAEPFILLDEGDHSILLDAFARADLTPRVEYTVTDDYSILAMVRQGLGVSAVYDLMLTGLDRELAVRPIVERPERSIALAWNRWDTLPLAARRFAEFILKP